MTIETLLNRLDGAKEIGHGKYVARCPAHSDRSPSLAIRECGDGRVLVHCFAGCETEDILDAVGLSFSDLMPERIGQEHNFRPLRQTFDARQVLECISHEAMVLILLAAKYANMVSDEDGARLLLAALRINTALASAPKLKTPPEIKSIRRVA